MRNFTKPVLLVSGLVNSRTVSLRPSPVVKMWKPAFHAMLFLLLCCAGSVSFAQTTTLAGGNVIASNLSPTISYSTPSVTPQIATFSLVQAGSGANLTQVKFTTTGTYSATTDITSFTLYVNTLANSLNGASAVPTGSITAGAAGLQTINLSTAYALSTSVNTYYFFIVPTLGSAPVSGNTIAVSSIPSTNIGVSAGSVSGSVPAQGTETIAAPSITSTTPGSRCGTGTVTLNATPATGTTVNWFSAATGGSSLATGNSFTTPSISGTTTYYAEGSQNATFQTGTLSDNTTNLAAYEMSQRVDLHWFSSTNAVTINSVDIYPQTAGPVVIEMTNGSGTVLATASTITITSGQISNTVPVTIPLGFSVPAGATNYTLGGDATFSTTEAMIYRGATAGNYGPYPATINGLTQTGDAATGAGFTGYGTRCYFYNWNVTQNIIKSPRTSDAATVNPVATGVTATVTPNPVCSGGNLTLTGAATGASGYSWTGPGGTAISSATSSTASVTGVVVGNSGVYTLTAVQGTCSVTATSATVTVNALPTPTFTTSPGAASCPSVNVTYTTQSGQSNYTWTFPGVSGTDYTLVSGGTTSSNTAVLQYLTAGSKTVSINYTSPAGCIGGTAGSATTTVSASPNVTGLSIPSNSTACTGSASVMTVNAASLAGGTYTVTYNLTGANTATGNTASMIFATGSGTFTTSTLSSSGSTTLTITSITSAGGCVSSVSAATRTFTVLTGAAPISGTANACLGSTVTLSDATSGGTWSSSASGIASVGSTGIVTGIALGTATITYALSSGCFVTLPFAVTTAPVTYTVTGGGPYCAGGPGALVGLNGSGLGVAYTLFNGATPLTPTVNGTGSAISFGYQTVSGTYTVMANYGLACTGGMLGSVVVTVNPLPTAFAVTGGGPYCSGGTGSAVGLSSSTIGVNYQLYNGTTPVGATVVGTGGAINFGLQVATGTYTVGATNASTLCTNTMTGSATVTTTPLPVSYSITGGGSYCLGGTGVPVGLANSATGISYQLLLGGTVVSTLLGTGGILNFGNQTTATTPGTSYTILATNLTTTCSVSMSGTATVTINPLPTVYTVTGGGAFCVGGSGSAVGLSSSQLGVNYQLYNGSTPVGAPVVGTGVSISFGLQTAVGSYTVLATNATTACTNNMFGSASVTTNPLPSAFVVTGGGGYCAGGVGVPVGLSGSTTGVNYVLYNASTVVSAASGTGGAINFGNMTAAGTYTVTATIPPPGTGCTANMSGSTTVTINPLPAVFPVTEVGTGAYCAGGTGVTIGLGGSATGINYQLYNGVTAVGAVVPGGTSAITFGAQTAAGSYTVQAINATTTCSSNMSGSATVTINPTPTVYTLTGASGYCAGGSTTIIGLSASNTGISYQLLNSGVPVGGASVAGTGAAINFGAQPAGIYTVGASNITTTCTVNMSGTISVSVNALPSAYTVTVSGGGAYCAGGSGLIITLGGSIPGVNYQLYNGSTLVGLPVAGTSSPLTYPVTAAGTYSLVGTYTSTGCSSAMTGTPTVTIIALPTVNAVTGGGNYCSGTTGPNVGLSSSSTGTSYQLFTNGAAGATLLGTGAALNFGAETTAGSYTVIATTIAGSCQATMSGSATVSVNPLPAAYTIRGGGPYCPGGAGDTIGLGNSAIGFSYQLMNGATPAGAPLSGTGASLNFGYQTAIGTYSVTATNSVTGCFTPMTGVATVSLYPALVVDTVTGGGSYCPGTSGVPVSINSSTSGVTYSLYNGGALVTSLPGSSPLSLNFGNQTTPGVYTVTARNAATSCSANMYGSATVGIYPLPVIYNISGGGNFCVGGTGVAVGLSGSNSAVSYQLNDVSAPAGAAVTGTGLALNFGLQTLPGAYTVTAMNIATGCTSIMNGTANVDTVSLPAAFNVTGGGNYCTGGTGVHIGLSGSVSGTDYQLVIGTSTPVGTLVAGTGAALDFGLQTATGTYSIIATGLATTCTNLMTGTAIVGTNTLPALEIVGGGGAYCAGGSGVSVTLGLSETTSSYMLYNGATPVGSAVTGTSGTLSFPRVTAAGTYSVKATNIANGCTLMMAGTVNVIVNPLPSNYIVTGGGAYCAGASGVHVFLSGSNSGINYQTKVGGTLGPVVAGTGMGLDLGFVTTAGMYNILATNPVTSCNVTMNDSVAVTINPLPPVHTVVSTSSSYCAGGTGVAVSLDGSDAGINYQLYNGSTVDGLPVAGTGSPLLFGSLTLPGSYAIVAANATTGCSINMLPGVSVTVAPLPVVFAITGGGHYCAGAAGVHIGLSGSTAGIMYRLYVAGTSFPVDSVVGTGAGVEFGLHTAAGIYSAVGMNMVSGCTNGMSGLATVTIDAVPTATAVSGSGSYCAGGTGLPVTIFSSSLGVTYQLMRGVSAVGSPVAGTGSGLSFGLQTVAGTYTVLATSTITGCENSMTGAATIVVTPAPASFAVTGGGHLCPGGTGVNVGLVNSATGVNYQLYDGATMVTTMAGTGSAINFGLETAAGSYTVTGIDATSGCTNTMSGVANVVIDPLPSVYAVEGGGSYCAGGAGVHVGLGGSNAGTNYTLYAGTITVVTLPGTGGLLDFGLQTMSGTYTVLATTAAGCTAYMSGSATVNATPVVVPTVNITIGGGSDTVCSGSFVTFTASATSGGATPSYQWAVGGVVASVGNIYSYSPSNMDVVSVILTSSAACATPATAGNSVVMIVEDRETPTVSISANTGNEVCQGTAVTYSAAPSFGGPSPSFEWFKAGLSTGVTAPTYNYTPANGDNIYCVMTSDYRCRLSTIESSNRIVMTVDVPTAPVVAITANPGQYVSAGQVVTLTAVVAGGGSLPAYQWLVNGIPIGGATNATYSSTGFNNLDSVTCQVTSTGGCAGLMGFNSVTMHVANVEVKGVTAATGNVQLLPNPNKGTFTLKGTIATAGDEHVTVEVVNMLGQVIYKQNIVAQNGTIDQQIQAGNSLANGMYILNLKSGAGNQAFHFVIEQ